MTGRQRTLAAIRGTPHDRIPVAQHNFTFCARQAGLTMAGFRSNPKRAAQALADAAYRFDYDCIIIDFDTCTLAEAMGAVLVFPQDEPARVAKPAVKSLADACHLPLPDPDHDGRLPLWLETTRELRRLVGDEKAIMGRADQGPFGLLFALRGHEELMMDVIEAPEGLLGEALAICTRAGVAFAKAQLAAGADLTSIGDSAAGESLISPAHYTRMAQPFQRQYKQALGDGLLSLHICGKTNGIIAGMIDTGCEVLELDHWNDLARSLDVVANRACIFGNIDPSAVLSQGSTAEVLAACRGVVELAKARTWRFALCPGCLANADVPPENIQAMTEAAQRWGVYSQPPTSPAKQPGA
jgi:MtaA/CmuA family methyltransferase